MSGRDQKDMNQTFEKVIEVVDNQNAGTVFSIKNEAPDVPFNKVEYIPKGPVMEHLRMLEEKQREKEEKYKKYAIDLKQKYSKFEYESQKHYAEILKR